MSYCKSKNSQNFRSFIMEGKISNVDAFIVFFLVVYININLNYYYYWYSALWPVWAETRVQSGDWYGSGTLHPGQVLRGSLPSKYTRKNNNISVENNLIQNIIISQNTTKIIVLYFIICFTTTCFGPFL